MFKNSNEKKNKRRKEKYGACLIKSMQATIYQLKTGEGSIIDNQLK